MFGILWLLSKIATICSIFIRLTSNSWVLLSLSSLIQIQFTRMFMCALTVDAVYFLCHLCSSSAHSANQYDSGLDVFRFRSVPQSFFEVMNFFQRGLLCKRKAWLHWKCDFVCCLQVHSVGLISRVISFRFDRHTFWTPKNYRHPPTVVESQSRPYYDNVSCFENSSMSIYLNLKAAFILTKHMVD